MQIKYGPEPEGCQFRIQSNEHEMGTYREAVISYDTTDPVCCAYAQKVEAGLALWEEADMWAPVTYDGAGYAIHIIRDPSLWSRTANPDVPAPCGRAHPGVPHTARCTPPPATTRRSHVQPAGSSVPVAKLAERPGSRYVCRHLNAEDR
jgi:hypothetical protein